MAESLDVDLSYIDKLQRANALDLAFFPVEALRRAADQGHILMAQENGEPAGYLWHGSVRPGHDITIYQACIDYEARRRWLGFGLVRRLIDIGNAAMATGIRLRCASSSDSNAFWAAAGFYCTVVTEGGRSRKRDINAWRTDIQPGLFRLSVEPSDRPMDRRDFYASVRSGDTGLLSRFAHPSRVKATAWRTSGDQ